VYFFTASTATSFDKEIFKIKEIGSIEVSGFDEEDVTFIQKTYN